MLWNLALFSEEFLTGNAVNGWVTTAEKTGEPAAGSIPG